jgi:hypothetical protein
LSWRVGHDGALMLVGANPGGDLAPVESRFGSPAAFCGSASRGLGHCGQPM